MTSEALVQLHGIRRSYKDGQQERCILNGVDASIAAGEAVVLFGPSGSGKSSLLHLLAGVDLPDAGALTILGQRFDQLSDAQRTKVRRERIGVIYQTFNLLPTLTVAEQVALRLELNKCSQAERPARIQQALEQVGLLERADTFPDRLSGGERQRVAVASALVHQPALVLADEPTGNLDDANAEMVCDLLWRLCRETGTSLVVASHDRRLADRADRVWQLHAGQLQDETP